MKKFLLSVFTALILAIPTQTLATENPYWNIKNFNSQIEIQKDSSISITETIDADFHINSRGIIRKIPVKYRNQYGHDFNLRFQLISVTDQNGNSLEYSKYSEGDSIAIRIGNPDIYFTGPKTYQIKYQVQRGINSFLNQTSPYYEIYWNITGNEWDTEIEKVTANVKLPGPNSLQESLCFTGYTYSKDQNCLTENSLDSYSFSTTKLLNESEGLTIVAKISPTLIEFPSTLTIIGWFLLDNWGYLIPILVFAVLYFKWYRDGRDPVATRSAIKPEYEIPDQLTPAELGTLIDDKVDMTDITSTIIDLATRGYLTIHEKTKKVLFGSAKDYTLEKTQKTSDDLNHYEKTIYNKIFESGDIVSPDDLKYSFYKIIPTVTKEIYQKLIANKYYLVNPQNVRDFYFSFAGAMFFILFFFVGPLAEFFPSIYFGLLLSTPIIFAFAFIMPKKTQKGADLKIKILGVEEFIKTAETDRMKFYEDQNIFEKMLPFAIALGLGEKWAKTFEGIVKNPPSWYQSDDPNFINNFSTRNFYNHFNSFNTGMSSSMIAAPRSTSSSSGFSGFSSGGGSSGGGFGGGGGGRW